LPLELGLLTELESLLLDHNPDMQSPPPDIAIQGMTAVLAYLRAAAHE
jgi:hypothetical protein